MDVSQLEQLTQLVQEKDAKIADLEKKSRLQEFRTKKQLQELQVQVEMEQAKTQEAFERAVRADHSMREFQEKAKALELEVMKVQQEKIELEHRKPAPSDKFRPRQSLVNQLGGNDAMLPSYGEIVHTFQRTEQEKEELQAQISKYQSTKLNARIQEAALQVIEEKDQQIAELERNLEEQRMLALHRNNNTNDNDKTEVLEQERQQLLAKLKEIGESNYQQISDFEDQTRAMEQKFREEFTEKTKEFEAMSNQRHDHLIDQLELAEEKLRQREDLLHEAEIKHLKVVTERDQLRTELTNAFDQQLKALQTELAKANDLHAKQVKEAKDQGAVQLTSLQRKFDELTQQQELQVKKMTKLESDRKKLDDQLKDLRVANDELQAQGHEKSAKMNDLIDEYERKLKDSQRQLKQVKQQSENQLQSQHELYEARIKELELQIDSQDDLPEEKSLGIKPRQSIIDPTAFSFSSEVFELKNEKAALLQELDEARTSIEMQMKQFQERERGLNEQCSDAANQNSTLHRQLEDMQRILDNLKEEVHSLQQHATSQSEHITNLEASSNFKEQSLQAEMQQLLLQHKSIVNSLEDQIQAARLTQETALSSHQQQLASLLAQQESLIQSHEKESLSHQEQKEHFKQTIATLEKQISALQQQLTSEANDHQASLKQLKDSHAAIITQKDHEIQSLHHLQTEIRFLKDQNAQLLSQQREQQKIPQDEDLLKLHQQLSLTRQREMDLIIERDDLITKMAHERSEAIINEKRLKGEIQGLRDDVERINSEREYMEAVASKSQLLLAEVSSEKDQNFFMYRRAQRELGEYRSKYGELPETRIASKSKSTIKK